LLEKKVRVRASSKDIDDSLVEEEEEKEDVFEFTGQCLKDVPKNQRNRRDFVLKAVKHDGMNLK
jgi:hypothetical protein